MRERRGTERCINCKGNQNYEDVQANGAAPYTGWDHKVSSVSGSIAPRPFLGTVPLEEMDRHVSPLKEKVLPNPESPDRPLLPLC